MKLFLYNLILFALTPFFALRILYKSFYDKDYRLNFLQRFGILGLKNINVPDTKIIWFHAVSLGEVIASQKMIKSLTKNYIINLMLKTYLLYLLEVFTDTEKVERIINTKVN